MTQRNNATQKWKKGIAAAIAVVALSSCGDQAANTAEEARRHIERAQAYSKQGQFRAAMIEARNAVRKAPNNPVALSTLGSLLLEVGDRTNVIKTLAPVAEGNDNLLKLLAKAYLETGKARSASETLEKVSAGGRDLEWRILSARTLFGLNQLADAREQLTALEKEHPESFEPNLRLAQIDLLEQKLDSALTQLQKADVKSPDNIEVLYMMGVAYHQQNKLDLAESNLSKALAQTTSSDVLSLQRTSILQLLAQVLTAQGRSADALIYSRLIAENNPGAQEARIQFNEALELYKQGDWATAEEKLSALYDLYPQNTLGALMLGVINFQQQDYEQATSLFNDHLDTETASTKVISAAAISQLKLEHSEEAVALLEEALKDHQDDPNLWSLYGLTLLNTKGGEQEGLIAVQKALALKPDHKNLRVAVAQHYLKNNKVEQALGQLNKAMEYHPKDTSLQATYIALLIRDNQSAQAESFVDKLERENGKSYTTQMMRAQLASNNKDDKSLEAYLASAAKLDSDKAQPLIRLGRDAINKKNTKEAIAHFENAINRESDSVIAYQGLFTAYEVDGKSAEGLAKLEKLAANKKNSSANAVLADYYLRKNDVEKAEQHLEKSKEDATTSQYVNSLKQRLVLSKAQNLIAAQKFDEARNVLNEAVTAQPKNVSFIVALARFELAQKAYDSAMEVTGLLNEIPGTNAISMELLGDIQNASGDKAAALGSYRAAWDQRPSSTVARKILPLVRSLEAAEGAEKFAAQWVESLPNDPAALVTKASALQSAGNCKDAIPLYERILDIRLTPQTAVVTANNLALCYLEIGDSKSVRMAEQAYNLAPKSASVVDTYGWVLFKTGEQKKGKELLAQALELDPDNPEIQAHIESAK